MPSIMPTNDSAPQAKPAPPCAMVIFGAAGDLTKRLVVPALYNLATTGLLPKEFVLIGVDNAELSTEQWRTHLSDMMHSFLSGSGNFPLCPEAATRRFRVLRELGLLQGSPESGAGVVRVVSSVRTDLQRSAAFRAYSARLSEARRSLTRPKLP